MDQIYAQITACKDTPPRPVVLKNLIFLVRTVTFGKTKALHHFEAAIRISRESALQGIESQALMHIGMLHKAKICARGTPPFGGSPLIGAFFLDDLDRRMARSGAA